MAIKWSKCWKSKNYNFWLAGTLGVIIRKYKEMTWPYPLEIHPEGTFTLHSSLGVYRVLQSKNIRDAKKEVQKIMVDFLSKELKKWK